MADNKDVSHLYYNHIISNPSNAPGPIACSKQQSFTQSLLQRADKYKASIQRFTLPVSSMPYFQCVPNFFFVTLSYNGSDYKQPVTIIPYTSTPNDINVYYVQQFIDSVNAALNTAYTALVTAVGSSSQFWPNRAPFFSFSSASNLISLTTDAGSWENTATGSPRVWLNTPLSILFANLPQINVATNSTSGKDNYLVITTRGATPISLLPTSSYESSNMQYLSAIFALNAGANTTYTQVTVNNLQSALPINTTLFISMSSNNTTTYVPPNPGTPGFLVKTTAAASAGHGVVVGVTAFTTDLNSDAPYIFLVLPTQLVTIEETPSVVSWWSTVSVVVKSSLLPARMEVVPSLAAGVYSSSPVLVDFVITPQDRLSANTSLVYLPSAEFRWFDLISDQELRAIDLAFFAADDAGNLTPIYLQPGQTCTTKILFARKCTSEKHDISDKEEGGRLPKLARLC